MKLNSSCETYKDSLIRPLGKVAVFRAVVTGDPKPEVSWRRAKGNLSDKEKFHSKYDESTGEHILEVSEQMIPHKDPVSGSYLYYYLMS